MASQRKGALHGNAKAANIKQQQRHFNLVNQFKQRFVRFSKWLGTVLI
ncbi:hypothetical protein [Methylomonas koyamae]|nr:hypothetical protein [Methylomonas koyamae]ATG89134.1 hypothetical protein MKLM6_0865 [Methylomonas koyamae]